MSRLNNPRYAPPRPLARGKVTTNQVWVLEGLCRDQAPMWDSSALVSDKREAMRLCGECPVLAQCTEAGRDEIYGIWGGVDKKNPELTIDPPERKKRPRREDAMDPIAQRKAANDKSAAKKRAATAALIARAETLARSGASVQDASDDLGMTDNALRQRLRNNGHADILDTLVNNRTRQQRNAKKAATT